MKVIAAIYILFLLNPALAGNEVGNGGDAVVCKSADGKIENVELLDFYEAKTQEQLDLITIDSEVSVINQVEKVLSKIKKHSPKLSRQYLKRSKVFMSEVSLVKDANLMNIEDSKSLVTPKSENCKIQQIAIFKKKHKSDKNFLIDKELWEAMDKTNKAGLILHEIIYEHFPFLGEKDSIKVRQVNSMLFSKKMDDMKTTAFWKKIQDLKLPIYREAN